MAIPSRTVNRPPEPQEKVNEVSDWVAQSRQWDTDRAAMQREIETLRAELKAVSTGNQTTET